jgi:hypothetical protein
MYRILIFTVVTAFSLLFYGIYNSNSLADIDFDEVVSMQKIDKMESISSCGVSGSNPYISWAFNDTISSYEIDRTFLFPIYPPHTFYTSNLYLIDDEISATLCTESLCNLVYDVYAIYQNNRAYRVNTCLYEGDFD